MKACSHYNISYYFRQVGYFICLLARFSEIYSADFHQTWAKKELMTFYGRSIKDSKNIYLF